jgi:hypothetical protein
MSYQKIKSNQFENIILGSNSQNLLLSNNNNSELDISLNRFLSGDISVSGSISVNDKEVVVEKQQTDNSSYFVFQGEKNIINGENVFIQGYSNNVNSNSVFLFGSESMTMEKGADNIFSVGSMSANATSNNIISVSNLLGSKSIVDKSFVSLFSFSNNFFNGESYFDNINGDTVFADETLSCSDLKLQKANVSGAFISDYRSEFNGKVDFDSDLRIMGNSSFYDLYKGESQVADELWVESKNYTTGLITGDSELSDGFSSLDFNVSGDAIMSGQSLVLLNEDFFVDGDFIIDQNLDVGDRFFKKITITGDIAKTSNSDILNRASIFNLNYIITGDSYVQVFGESYITGEITGQDSSIQNILHYSGDMFSDNLSCKEGSFHSNDLKVGGDSHFTGSVNFLDQTNTGFDVVGAVNLSSLDASILNVNAEDLNFTNFIKLGGSNLATESWIQNNLMTGFDQNRLNGGFNSSDSYFNKIDCFSGVNIEGYGLDVENLYIDTGAGSGEYRTRIKSNKRVDINNSYGNISYGNGSFSDLIGYCDNLQIENADQINLSFINGASEKNWVFGTNIILDIDDSQLSGILVDSGVMNQLFENQNLGEIAQFANREVIQRKTRNTMIPKQNNKSINVEISLKNDLSSNTSKYINSSSVGLSKGCLRFSNIQNKYRASEEKNVDFATSLRDNLVKWYEFGYDTNKYSIVDGDITGSSSFQKVTFESINGHWDDNKIAFWESDTSSSSEYFSLRDSTSSEQDVFNNNSTVAASYIRRNANLSNSGLSQLIAPSNGGTPSYEEGCYFIYESGSWHFQPRFWGVDNTISSTSTLDIGWEFEQFPEFVTVVGTSQFYANQDIGQGFKNYYTYKTYLNGGLVHEEVDTTDTNYNQVMFINEHNNPRQAMAVQNAVISSRPWGQSEIDAYSNSGQSIPYWNIYQ